MLTVEDDYVSDKVVIWELEQPRALPKVMAKKGTGERLRAY